MFILNNYPAAILFCFVTMLCWGSWANTQKLTTPGWQFELFYWDYCLGIFLLAMVMAVTIGSHGAQGRSFGEDWKGADPSNLVSAFSGGVLFNLANILLVAAIAQAGMSVAFPVGIGIALILGVVVNYVARPQGNPVLLFSGVALVALAILLNADAYRKMSRSKSSFFAKGLLLSALAGVLMGFFYKYVAASMISDFALPEPGKLTPYTALVLFASGVLASNFLFNSVLMLRPITGKPIAASRYFHGAFRDHAIGILGGLIWQTGMAFSILASGKAGPAISYGLGQGATIVAALWGIFIWKEFAGAAKSVYRELGLMLILYAGGLLLIIAAK
jgi:glucose uptake protein